MPDWETDSSQGSENLKTILRDMVRSSHERKKPTLESAREWHKAMMMGLSAPDPRWIGTFRGEPGLELVQVRIGSALGTPAPSVAGELSAFEAKLQQLVHALDQLIPQAVRPNLDQLSAVLDLCAWAHSEWVRIHPFANGSGRTARLWVNSLAVRYSLPPFLRMRPRPGGGYSEAGARAMHRDWKPTAVLFLVLLSQYPE
jgi:fido (protein-threonine AMPylation protein)